MMTTIRMRMKIKVLELVMVVEMERQMVALQVVLEVISSFLLLFMTTKMLITTRTLRTKKIKRWHMRRMSQLKLRILTILLSLFVLSRLKN